MAMWDSPKVTSYREAREFLGSRDRRKLANNTYLERRDENTIAVRLHATDVVTFRPQSVEINTGGWFTVTTKNRINRFSPIHIYSERRRWLLYLNKSEDVPYPNWESQGYIYYDGIRVTNDGLKVRKPRNVPPVPPATSEIITRINAFVRESIKQLNEGLPIPSGADCWYCAMQTEDGATLGDAFTDTDHLENHIAENYVVPSLLWHAVSEAGYRYPEVILGVYDCGNGSYRMGGTVTNDYGTRSRAMTDSVARSLRRYLKRRLVPTEQA